VIPVLAFRDIKTGVPGVTIQVTSLTIVQFAVLNSVLKREITIFCSAMLV
jgi:hypothetical protein